jgi:hypothetical protein
MAGTVKSDNVLARRVIQLERSDGKMSEQLESAIKSQPLDDFDATPAWVLLGEPGSGKTTAMRAQANNSQSVYLRIADFISGDLDESWRDKVLFLDGLDEVRASGSGEVLSRVQARLKQLRCTHYRLACRIADWRGSSDKEDLSRVLGLVPIELQLAAFTHEEKLELLTQLEVTDPSAFMNNAQEAGIMELLDNPQTMELLAAAVSRGEAWPTTRKDVYELACLKMAEEANKPRRNAMRLKAMATPEEIVNAAGYVMAVLLLSDQVGVALDADQVDHHYFLAADLPVTFANALLPTLSRQVILQSLDSKLFRPNETRAEQVIPVHRSIAEYLAARWLGKQLDQAHLPLSRLQSALLGEDGGVVAGLRGMYAWLTVCSGTAQSSLLQADVLAVIVYGDVSRMDVATKRKILSLLQQIFKQNPRGYWQLLRENAARFSGLVDERLIPELKHILKAQSTEGAATLRIAILWALLQAEPLELMNDALHDFITSRDDGDADAKELALEAWLAIPVITKAQKLQLLQAIEKGSVSDPSDALMGCLLGNLHPHLLDTAGVLEFLHEPKNESHHGSYYFFWVHQFLKTVEKKNAVLVMRHLQKLVPKEGFATDAYLKLLPVVLNKVLPLALAQSGDDATDAELFDWLHVGVGEHLSWQRSKESQECVAAWMNAHPNRYKGLLSECLKRSETQEQWNQKHWLLRDVLTGVNEPLGLDAWYLQQTEYLANDELINACLIESLRHQWFREGNELSIEAYEQWATGSPQRQQMLAAQMVCILDENTHWRLRRQVDKTRRQNEHAQRKREATKNIAPYLDAIAAGKASAGAMYNVTMAWQGRLMESHGENPRQRIDHAFENGEAVYAAASKGLPLCIERTDLPSIDEILALSVKNEEHLIRPACLLGMELRYAQEPAAIDQLPEPTLQKMAAFWLTYSCHPTPDWWHYLVKTYPHVIADVFVTYVLSALRTKATHVTALYELRADSGSHALALAVTPRLLQGFPVRATKDQGINSLSELLKIGVLLLPEETLEICKTKLTKRSLDETQKTLWLGAATLLGGKKYEDKLFAHLGTSEARVQDLLALSDDSARGRGVSIAALYWPLLVKQKLIELLTPHAQFERPNGAYTVTDAMTNAERIQAWINQIVNAGSPQAKAVLDHLQTQVHLQPKLRYLLESAQATMTQRLRETNFHFLSVKEASALLGNQAPVHIQDLQALVLNHLQDIQREIQTRNDDGYRLFWNEVNGECDTPKYENSCRDALLGRLKEKLNRYGVSCDPEGDFSRDKRADIQISFQTQMKLAIEVKRAQHTDLWEAAETQLAANYAIDPLASEYGLYLVLWFGADPKFQTSPKDGGKRAVTADELQQRLTAHLAARYKPKIQVFVLNVDHRQEQG